MSQTLVLPQCSASPAGGGTCSYSIVGADTASEASNNVKSDRGWQDYLYKAEPNLGYHFVKFEVTVKIYQEEYEYVYDKQGTWNAQLQAYTYETDGSSDDEYLQDGAAWWKETYTWNNRQQTWVLWYVKNVEYINVVAVFEADSPTPTEGPYLLYDDTTGQLLYAPSSGQLIYGGSIT